MLRSSDCVAIHLADITAAENFYTNVMKFRLLARSEQCLEYDTGRYHFYVNKNVEQRRPIPSFTVEDLAATKRALVANGCTILREDSTSAHFRDQFGITYDVVECKPKTRPS
jgi:catechol 2,3-dioxygenase-like lactoylglutathione lyase family enzyme